MREFLKQRSNANLAAGISVALHLGLVLLAATFQTIWFTRVAALSGFLLYCILGPVVWLWHRTTLPANDTDGLSDIRDAFADAAQLETYDPEPYFELSRGIFVGRDIDKNDEPLYVPWSRLGKTHMQVVGTTGSGKGVATTMMLTQCALAGECIVIFDPKFPGDEFAPRVFNRFAQQHNIPFYLVNLSNKMPAPLNQVYPITPPQLNIFGGCSAAQLEELLTAGFRLENTGSTADHYRLHDRLACKDVARLATENGTNATIRDLLAAANRSRRVDDEKGADFKANLEEIEALSALHTTEGYDLRAILEQNAILYIIGDIRHEPTIRIQRMLLLRILQLIEERNRMKQLRPVAIMLDELKYMLSKGALQALGTVRDKKCHIFLAHQTLGDLRDVEGLDPEAVTAAVKGNTSLKLIYRITDPDDTGRWASELSGTIIAKQQSTHMQQGMFSPAEGQYRDTERPLLTINELLALPDQSGMLFGVGISRRIQVGPMKLGDYPSLTPAQPLAERENRQTRRQRRAAEAAQVATIGATPSQPTNAPGNTPTPAAAASIASTESAAVEVIASATNTAQNAGLPNTEIDPAHVESTEASAAFDAEMEELI